MLNHDAGRDDSATATQSLQIPGTSENGSLAVTKSSLGQMIISQAYIYHCRV